MAYSDMREFMQALKEAGELIEIDCEVDWKLEAGAIVRRTYEIGAPAVHLKKIKGYPETHTMAGNMVGKGWRNTFSKLAIALELDPETPYKVISEEFNRRSASPIKPYQVSTGPCKENIHFGKEVNLFEFPAPYLHEGDGGRYFGTWGATITKDPDSDWTNYGLYRQMIHTRNRAGGLVIPYQHIGMMYYRKYEARNQPMPFALAFGTEPCSTIVAAMGLAAGVNEVDIAGGLRREPVQLVKCETSDLLVPATSEIVVEGVMMPGERWDEGPFGEFTGYRASPRMPRPVYRVECITHRDNPILPVSCMGTPVDESDMICGCVGSLAEVLEVFKSAGLPVKSVYSPPEYVGFLLVVSVEKSYPGLAHEVVSILHSTKAGFRWAYVIICDADVDASDLSQAFHSLVTKCHPVNGTQVKDYSVGHALAPFLNLHERHHCIGASVVFDSTWPVEWDPLREVPQKVSFAQVYPKELQDKVISEWADGYGLPAEAGIWRRKW